MPLSLPHLDDETRKFMLEEIELDIERKTLYISPRLSKKGSDQYPDILKESVRYDDVWLAAQLGQIGFLNAMEPRRTKSGQTMVKVPVTAPDTLAEGEFNRFYIRGLCRRAIDAGTSQLVVYRAKEVMHARSESTLKIGKTVDPEILLEDLRANPGIDTALGLPPGPNSGLSLKLP